MLAIQEIEKQYPEHLRVFRRSMLREYLQYRILQIIFDSPHGSKLSFLGGTALRIIHGNTRFSEDLDFDHFGISEEEFASLADTVRKSLSLEGYEVETKNVFKGAFRCYVRFPKLLFSSGLSALEEEKILIQLDTLAHGFDYRPQTSIINKFETFVDIRVTPIDILLSQKVYAAFGRKAKKGRDFFDIVFLLSLTKPNYEYLRFKLGIDNAQELRERLIALCETLDFAQLAEDVKPFLFFQRDAKKVELFASYMQTVVLE